MHATAASGSPLFDRCLRDIRAWHPGPIVLTLALLVLAAFAPAAARAAPVRVAVAANFTDAAKEIGKAFETTTGNTVAFSFGSTGQLYTQIGQGAPYDVFLSADQARPERAEKAGLAVPGSRFTYATGKIVLYSTDPTLVTGPQMLKAGSFDKLAIANPAIAPYGAAAVATMQALGVYGDLKPKLVEGANISQTYQFVATGNAALGFVALSEVIGKSGGSRWIVPQTLYPPIAQDAVLLKAAADNPAAKSFMAFLKGPQAKAIIARYGYGTGA